MNKHAKKKNTAGFIKVQHHLCESVGDAGMCALLADAYNKLDPPRFDLVSKYYGRACSLYTVKGDNLTSTEKKMKDTVCLRAKTLRRYNNR
jgi:hypothetical protein